MQLVLYVRSYCHLCEELIAALAPWRERHAFDLRIIDIEDDAVLEMRYGTLVPVLCAPDGSELCHYRLDEARLDAYLAQGQR